MRTALMVQEEPEKPQQQSYLQKQLTVKMLKTELHVVNATHVKILMRIRI